MENQNRETNLPFLRSQSSDSAFTMPQSRHLLMTHSATLPRSSAAISSGGIANFNIQRRSPVEGARQFRLNLTNVIREIQPLVEYDLTNFLNRPTHSAPNVSTNDNPNGSFVINIEEPGSNSVLNNGENTFYNHSHANVNANNNSSNNNNINPMHVDPNVNHNNNNNNNNNGTENSTTERLQTVLEAQHYMSVLQKYVPFILILFAKGLYDHHEGILNLIVLLATFTHANSVVRKEATKRSRRNLSKLFCAFLYIICAIVFIHYIFEEEKLYLNLIFIRTYNKPLTVWDLLWIVGITDFILKLITVMLKILLTLLPDKIVAFQKRGKIYLFMEAVSQLYRSLAPIQPWLYYILESYQGPEKIVGVFLAAAYMVSKGSDLMSKLKLVKTAVLKLLQNVTVGSSPSKEQIQTAGEHCPICHDEYDSPVLLQCRHIFCESCVTTWFDREQTCPLCRAKIVDDPSWRDGSTTFFMQLF